MIRKEFIAILKDKKSRFILIGPVIIQTLLFGYVATYNLDEVSYAVLDGSRSRYSADFLAKLDGSGIFKRAATLENTEQTAEWIDSGKVLSLIHI